LVTAICVILWHTHAVAILYLSLATRERGAMQLLQLAAAPLATYAARSSQRQSPSFAIHVFTKLPLFAFCLAAAPLCIFKSCTLACISLAASPSSFFSVHQRDPLESRRALASQIAIEPTTNLAKLQRWLLHQSFSITRKQSVGRIDWQRFIFKCAARAVGRLSQRRIFLECIFIESQ
jgi:hypothetical protein